MSHNAAAIHFTKQKVNTWEGGGYRCEAALQLSPLQMDPVYKDSIAGARSGLCYYYLFISFNVISPPMLPLLLPSLAWIPSSGLWSASFYISGGQRGLGGEKRSRSDVIFSSLFAASG